MNDLSVSKSDDFDESSESSSEITSTFSLLAPKINKRLSLSTSAIPNSQDNFLKAKTDLTVPNNNKIIKEKSDESLSEIEDIEISTTDLPPYPEASSCLSGPSSVSLPAVHSPEISLELSSSLPAPPSLDSITSLNSFPSLSSISFPSPPIAKESSESIPPLLLKERRYCSFPSPPTALEKKILSGFKLSIKDLMTSPQTVYNSTVENLREKDTILSNNKYNSSDLDICNESFHQPTDECNTEDMESSSSRKLSVSLKSSSINYEDDAKPSTSYCFKDDPIFDFTFDTNLNGINLK